ncbi:g3447 [Coccomyxa elongata]
MLSRAAIEPLGALGDDVAPGFDVRKDPGEEEAESGNVVGVRISHRAVVGISSGPGDVIVGPGGPERLGGEVEDTVVVRARISARNGTRTKHPQGIHPGLA